MKLKNLALLAMMLMLITACKTNSVPSTQPTTQETASNAVIGNQTIIDEVGRLTSLAAKESVTTSDFNDLEQMLKPDADASDELQEAIVLVKYQEYEHTVHTLGFIAEYLNTGKELLCPGHAVLHYYVYMKHGEDDLANDQLSEAKENFDAWEPKAREYNQKYPSGTDFDTISNRIQNDIKRIDAGNTTANDDEIAFLDGVGSLCVEADDSGQE